MTLAEAFQSVAVLGVVSLPFTLVGATLIFYADWLRSSFYNTNTMLDFSSRAVQEVGARPRVVGQVILSVGIAMMVIAILGILLGDLY